MSEPKSIPEFLLIVKKTPLENIILSHRYGDPKKNPMILMEAMGYTLEDVKVKVLDRLSPQECRKMCQENLSEGKTSLIWVFERYQMVINSNGDEEEFHIYIKLTIQPESHITAISFHSWDLYTEKGVE